MKRDPRLTVALAGALCGGLACAALALSLPEGGVASGCIFGVLAGGLLGLAVGALLRGISG